MTDDAFGNHYRTNHETHSPLHSRPSARPRGRARLPHAHVPLATTGRDGGPARAVRLDGPGRPARGRAAVRDDLEPGFHQVRWPGVRGLPALPAGFLPQAA